MKGMMGKKKRLGMVLTAWLATLMHAMATCMPTSFAPILCQIVGPTCDCMPEQHALLRRSGTQTLRVAQAAWCLRICQILESLETGGDHILCIRMPCAAWYNTWLLITLLSKGEVFSFLHAHNCSHSSSQQASLMLLTHSMKAVGQVCGLGCIP